MPTCCLCSLLVLPIKRYSNSNSSFFFGGENKNLKILMTKVDKKVLLLLLQEHTKNSNSRTIETKTNSSNEDTYQGYPILPARRIQVCTCTGALPFLHFGPKFFPHTQQQWKPRGARRQELQPRNKKPRISKARRQNKCPPSSNQRKPNVQESFGQASRTLRPLTLNPKMTNN